MALLKRLSSFNDGELPQVLQQISDIFYLSSSVKEFESEEKKKRFFNRWLGHYLSHYSDTTWIAVAEGEAAKVLAYLTVCPDTLEFMKSFPLASLELFKDCYQSYPAHLHMNTHPEARGQGLGAKLVLLAFAELQEQGVSGWHLITGESERNVGFYEH